MLWRTLKERQEFVGLENSHGTGQQSSGETEREMYISYVKVPYTNLPKEIVLVETSPDAHKKRQGNPTTSEKLFYCQFIWRSPCTFMVPTQISYNRDKICQRLTYVQCASSKGTNDQSYNDRPTIYGITEFQKPPPKYQNLKLVVGYVCLSTVVGENEVVH